MIPDSDQLFKRVCHKHVQFLILNGSDYFALADEYVNLQKIFMKDGVYDTVGLWFDMIVSPILTILHSLWKQIAPSIFTVLSFQKCVTLWKQWFRFQDLKKQIHEWMNIVRSIGGPFISSNDPEYHVFVYADAMQRLHRGLTTAISKKRAERLKQFSSLLNRGLHFR
jgi:hypothetical protein